MPIHEKAAQADSCTAKFIRTCHCQGRRHVRKARKKDGGHGVLQSPNNLSVKEKQVFSNSGHPPQHERFTYFSPLPEATPQGFFDIWGVRHDWKVQRTSWDVESTLDGSFSCMNGPLPWWNQRAPLSFIKGSAWCFSPCKNYCKTLKLVHVFLFLERWFSVFQVRIFFRFLGFVSWGLWGRGSPPPKEGRVFGHLTKPGALSPSLWGSTHTKRRLMIPSVVKGETLGRG